MTYFGLPSGGLYDVLQWKEFIGRIIAVEREAEELRGMIRTAFKHGLTSIQFLRGDVDAILVNGTDEQGVAPEPPSFDVINLDYYGGLLMRDLTGTSRHISAIRALLNLQANHQQDFLLFLTANVRDKDRGELDYALETLEAELVDLGVEAHETVEWYRQSGIAQKIKVYLPRLLSVSAVTEGLSLTGYEAVYYQGRGNTHLVHFALRFICEEQLMGGFYSPRSLLLTPLNEVRRGKLSVIEESPPSPPMWDELA